ncbi:MAG: diguanylate cyclase [Desulfuromonadaceae bacterium]|nr:diguanylate cyclase [Desulfuromonadaceae bacterium]
MSTVVRLVGCACWLLLLGGLMLSQAEARELRIGVLVFQNKDVAAKEWQDLNVYLNHLRPDVLFRILPLGKDELKRAVQDGQIDFMLANPAVYIRYQRYHGLSSPLVTVMHCYDEKSLHGFGVSIFCRADRADIQCFADLREKRFAVPYHLSFGTAIVQHEMLLNDLPEVRPEHLVEVGFPQQNTIWAVLQGQADFGFARAGLLEQMAANGKLDLDQLRILNRQPFADYPFLVSSHLFPEWPLAALRHVSLDDQCWLTAALLQWRQADHCRRPFSLHGFRTPADYTVVEEVMRKLRFPPFDSTPDVRTSDLWTLYRSQILVLLVLSAAIFALGLYLYLSRLQLNRIRRELQSSNKKLEQLATVDGLTGVGNRRSFDEASKRLWASAQRNRTLLGLLMVDIDFFKAYNDALGHQQGDWCLQQVAQLLGRACKRPDDLIARYGGEEFAILLPQASLDDCRHIARHIQAQLAERAIPHPCSEVSPSVTLSIGCHSQLPGVDGQLDEFILTADRRLYVAKNKGRNRICWDEREEA